MREETRGSDGLRFARGVSGAFSGVSSVIRRVSRELVEAGQPAGRFDALTSLRGIAAWWVVIYHFRFAITSVLPGFAIAVANRGYLAVDMFFILSGFVIGLNYGSWFKCSVPENWFRFLGLRLARIYPLHLVVMLAFLINPLLVLLASTRGDVSQYGGGYFVESLLLVQAWGFRLGPAWNVPAWSISAEWFVYIVFPMLALANGRMVRSPRSALLWMVIPLAFLFVGRVLLGVSLVGDVGRLAVPRCLLEFTAGLGLVRLCAMVPKRASLTRGALLLGTILLGLVVGDVLQDEWAPPAFAALIFALTDSARAPARWLGNGNPLGRVFLAMGTVSYATYICHYLVRSWVRFVLVRPDVNPVPAFLVYLAATALASPILYLMIERPGRQWGRALLGIRPRAVVAPVL